MDALKGHFIEVRCVTIMEFGMLNEFIEDNFEHVEAEYHYDSSVDSGIVRLYSKSSHIQEFMEAVRLLFLIMETEV